MKDNDQKCVFCGGKTKIASRKTGINRILKPGDEFWKGRATDRIRYYVMCNRCHSKGPLSKSEQEAIDAYRPSTN